MAEFPGGDAAHLSGLPDPQTAVNLQPGQGASRRPREQSAEWQNFPEAMLRICPGYQTRRRR
ncbi:TPA: hypothetical protein LVL72_003046, partial [Klebsiella oxytoca]|nr:hypothetical protein [Klebsiella oxytoca]